MRSTTHLLGWFSIACSFVGCATIQDKHYENTQILRTESAFARTCMSCGWQNFDYAAGWKAGYLDVSTGGCGKPPMVAPHQYWRPSQVDQHCDEKRLEWYRGFQDGAADAMCQPDTHYVKLWLPTMGCPQPGCPIVETGYPIDGPILEESWIEEPETFNSTLNPSPVPPAAVNPPMDPSPVSDEAPIETPASDLDATLPPMPKSAAPIGNQLPPMPSNKDAVEDSKIESPTTGQTSSKVKDRSDLPFFELRPAISDTSRIDESKKTVYETSKPQQLINKENVPFLQELADKETKSLKSRVVLR